MKQVISLSRPDFPPPSVFRLPPVGQRPVAAGRQVTPFTGRRGPCPSSKVSLVIKHRPLPAGHPGSRISLTPPGLRGACPAGGGAGGGGVGTAAGWEPVPQHSRESFTMSGRARGCVQAGSTAWSTKQRTSLRCPLRLRSGHQRGLRNSTPAGTGWAARTQRPEPALGVGNSRPRHAQRVPRVRRVSRPVRGPGV